MSIVIFKNLSDAKTLYCAVVSDHCVIAIMAFLQSVSNSSKDARMCVLCFDLWRCENVYNTVLFPFPDAVVYFALSSGVENIVPSNSYSPVLAHKAVVRSSQIGWDQKDCSGLYSYDYQTAEERKCRPHTVVVVSTLIKTSSP